MMRAEQGAMEAEGAGMLTLAWGERTHAGRVRSRNEDALLATPPLFAVADGMGGHAAGDLASALTVQTLAELAASVTLTRTEVLDAVRAANATIAREASDSTRGMGTTLCGLAVTTSLSGPDGLVVFNVGDSRAYRLRDGRLEQLTQDHSVVQELVDAGEISSDDAATHPDRHVITRSLGAGDHVDIDWWTLEPTVGDRFLLTSDGLTKELEIAEIAAIMNGADTPKLAAERLVDEALAHGGSDNISVVIVEVVAIDGSGAPGFDPTDAVDADTIPRQATLGISRTEGVRLDPQGIDADTNPAGPANPGAGLPSSTPGTMP